GLELAAVGITVLINPWNARFYNALQDRSWNNFVHEILVFACLAALFIWLRVYQTYLTQWLQIRWRRWLTKRFLRRWLYGANHYRMQVSGGGLDNPDQRIAEGARSSSQRCVTSDWGISQNGSMKWRTGASNCRSASSREWVLPALSCFLLTIFSWTKRLVAG